MFGYVLLLLPPKNNAMMLNIEFKDGTKFVVQKEKLNDFVSQNAIPYKEYLEFIVRQKLGQKFDDYNDYKAFKISQEKDGYKASKSEHLRFEMRGQRDDDGGINENIDIFNLFNLPITLKWANNEDDAQEGDYKNLFTFHKGTPVLFERKSKSEVVEVAEYGGWGTVEILIELITKFGVDVIPKTTVKIY